MIVACVDEMKQCFINECGSTSNSPLVCFFFTFLIPFEMSCLHLSTKIHNILLSFKNLTTFHQSLPNNTELYLFFFNFPIT